MVLLDLGTAQTPPWLPLVVVGVLFAVLVFLYFSLRKQLRKIDVPQDAARPASRPFERTDRRSRG